MTSNSNNTLDNIILFLEGENKFCNTGTVMVWQINIPSVKRVATKLSSNCSSAKQKLFDQYIISIFVVKQGSLVFV